MKGRNEMDINELRDKIDSIDSEILKLFTQRMKISLEIAKYKKENNLPIQDKKRERELIRKVDENAETGLEIFSRMLFNTLMDLSRSYQYSCVNQATNLAKIIADRSKMTPRQFPEKAVVAVQGDEGSYGQFACDKLIKIPTIMYFNSFEAVFQAVEKGLCHYGVLPLENSTAGSVNQVYDLMGKYKFFIVRSARLRVDHTLLAKRGVKLSDIKEVVSHEQALNQCSDFLATLKGVKVTKIDNTALAAKYVSESGRDDIAAISSKDCADIYNLAVLSYNIQNNDNNYTRFICISKDLEIYPGADRTSITLTIPHKPGALYHVLARFYALGLNLAKIESRPIPGRDFEFLFYFDIDTSVYTPELFMLISELECGIEQFNYLGSYKEIL
jgi:chorismate mutase/prephenate dehydratase